jgi:hypothetical protein
MSSVGREERTLQVASEAIMTINCCKHNARHMTYSTFINTGLA